MTVDTTEELWGDIQDYPKYEISNRGDIMNIRTGGLVKPQLTPQGVLYISLYDGEKSSTRSVKVLVAKAFVTGETDIFDTPINIDGDKTNCAVENLAWRPRSFAVRFSRQFLTNNPNQHVGPVYDISTGAKFDNIYEVATTFGLLFKDIYRSVYASTPVFPTDQLFRIPNPIHVR